MLEKFAYMPIPFLFLMMIYFFLMISALLNYIKLLKSPCASLSSKSFYFSIMIECFCRVITMLILIASIFLEEPSEKITKVFINMIYIPAILMIISFILLLWQLIIIFYLTHININKDFNENSPAFPLKRSFIRIIFITISFYLIIHFF